MKILNVQSISEIKPQVMRNMKYKVKIKVEAAGISSNEYEIVELETTAVNIEPDTRYRAFISDSLKYKTFYFGKCVAFRIIHVKHELLAVESVQGARE